MIIDLDFEARMNELIAHCEGYKHTIQHNIYKIICNFIVQ